MEIIKRGKIFWLIAQESVVAFDRRQATIYQLYGYPNKKPLELMKQTIRNSKPHELGTWVDVIGLATKTKIRGYGTKLQAEWIQAIESNEFVE